MAKSAKRPKNLSLAPDAIARGEQYSARHDTSLSQLVGDFLRALPLESDDTTLSPVVRRLRGVAVGKQANGSAHRSHLLKKYGAR